MKISTLTNNVIIQTLHTFGFYSQNDVGLLLGIFAHESLCGYYIVQKGTEFINSNLALGMYQMELATAKDILRYLKERRPELYKKFTQTFYDERCDIKNLLVGDIFFATAMARFHFLRFPEPIPPLNDIKKIAEYWKKYYNTPQGKGTISEFIMNYKKYILNN